MRIRYKPHSAALALAAGGLLACAASAAAEAPVAGCFPAISPVKLSPANYYPDHPMELDHPVPAVRFEPAKGDPQTHRLVCWPFHKKCAPGSPEPPAAKEKEPPKVPEKEPDKKMDQPPEVPVFQPEQAAAGGSDTFAYNPQMLGDFIGPIGTRLFRAGFDTGSFVTPINAYVTAPILSQSSFKIAENESPRPVDRVFGCYNYYNSVAASVQMVSQTSPFPIDRIHFDIHRETFGFEKTFLNGDASFGLRVPVAQAAGSFRTFPFGVPTFSLIGDLDESDSGDLSIIFKYALINNRATGNLLSCGLVITLPTGDDFIGFAGQDLNPVLIQPWLGGIYNSGNWYLQGFGSLVEPTDSLEPAFMALDLGAGYWLVRNNRARAIRSIVPTAEAHLTTSLNHGGDNELITVPDLVVFTGGVHLQLDERVWLTVGVGAPVTGQREYAMQTYVQFNWRF